MHSVESVTAVMNDFPALSYQKLTTLYTKFDAYDVNKDSKITATNLVSACEKKVVDIWTTELVKPIDGVLLQNESLHAIHQSR